MSGCANRKGKRKLKVSTNRRKGSQEAFPKQKGSRENCSSSYIPGCFQHTEMLTSLDDFKYRSDSADVGVRESAT